MSRDLASHYRILEVDADASGEEIDAAYQRLREILEPDSLALYSMADEHEIDSLRRRVEEAYYILADPRRRAAYDRGEEIADYPPLLVPHAGGGSTSSMGDFATVPRAETTAAVVVPAPPLERTPPVPVAPVALLPPAPDVVPIVAPVPPPQAVAPPAAVVIDVAAPPEPAPVEQPRVVVLEAPAAKVTQRPARRLVLPREMADLSANAEVSGALLRSLRESAGASLDDIAEITKITKRYLRAIEENDFAALPAQVYVRGFVAEYARVFGLNPQQFAKSYMTLYMRYRSET